MTVKILLRLPGLAITSPMLQGLADRARRHSNVSPDDAQAALLATVEAIAAEMDDLAAAFHGKKIAVVEEDFTVHFIEEPPA